MVVGLLCCVHAFLFFNQKCFVIFFYHEQSLEFCVKMLIGLNDICYSVALMAS